MQRLRYAEKWMRKRLAPEERRNEVMRAALHAAQRYGWSEMTRDHIATAAGSSPGLVSARLGTMQQVRDAVMEEAVRLEVLAVIAQGIAARHPTAMSAPAQLQRSALASLAPRIS
jgi:AcrR family transcriptional regulator